MDFYSTNLSKIQQRHPVVYKALISYRETASRYEIIPTADRNFTLKMMLDREFFLSSKFAPAKEAERFVKEYNAEDIESFIVYGFGLGYHIREFLRSMGSSQRLYVIDLSVDIFKAAVSLQDMGDVLEDERLELRISDDIREISGVLSLLSGKGKTKFVIHPPSVQCIDKKYGEFKFTLENWRIRLNSYERFKGLMQENLQANKACLDRNVGEFFNKFVNRPVVIISAGPSLDKNIALLKEIREKAVLLAVGRALKPLAHNGIQPDFFVVTDPQELVREQIRGMEDMGIPGFFMMTTHYAAVRDYRGPRFAVCAEEEHLPEGNKQYLVETGGSVATTALDIAIKMGGNPIAFVGQDLAYTGGRHHAQGTQYSNEENPEVSHTGEALTTRGWDGSEVATSMPFLSFKKWMEDRISREKDRVFINATEGGAFIEGCRHIRLREFIDGYVK